MFIFKTIVCISFFVFSWLEVGVLGTSRDPIHWDSSQESKLDFKKEKTNWG